MKKKTKKKTTYFSSLTSCATLPHSCPRFPCLLQVTDLYSAIKCSEWFQTTTCVSAAAHRHSPQSWGQRDPFPTQRPVKPFKLSCYWPACTPHAGCSVRLNETLSSLILLSLLARVSKGFPSSLERLSSYRQGWGGVVDLCRVSSSGLKRGQKQTLHFLFSPLQILS